MSRNNNPIPTADRQDFFAAMAAIETEAAGLADSYWLMLDAAEEFMVARRYQRGDPVGALKQYRRMKAEAESNAKRFPGVDIDAVHRNQRPKTKGT